ncbi:LON peptidase substrate-binding domain-containing protein [Halobacteriovorax sp.]|uniref:LON peptidase substrate-binding domain-containing protein n=1 Tax=Halobacteriovorax sp. TaxID=2020862 RepID=UPI00356ACFFD
MSKRSPLELAYFKSVHYYSKMLKQVFIFPLPKISLQPGARKPLNVFEPRYLKMVKDAVSRKIPIALAYGIRDSDETVDENYLSISHESLPSVRRVVCMGVPEIIQECNDGSMIIMLQGEGRGRLLQEVESVEPYIICEYEEFCGSNELRDENILLLRRLKTQLEKWVKKKVKLECQKNILNPCITQPCKIIGLYAELMIDSPEVKQEVLEMSDINDKIQYIVFNC